MKKETQASHDAKLPAGAPADKTEPPREIDARELLGHKREATIVHAGERYRLRLTANNKLILTK